MLQSRAKSLSSYDQNSQDGISPVIFFLIDGPCVRDAHVLSASGQNYYYSVARKQPDAPDEPSLCRTFSL